MKKFFEKHDLVKIVLGMILLTVILTWIIPQSSFSTGEFVKGEITRIGLFDLGTYGLLGMYYFTVLVTFIFVLGAFYQFLSKLGAYQKLTDSLAKLVKGKEILFSLIVSFVIAALTSMINEYLIIVAFIPFIITLCSKAGMDKMSSFVATFGSMLVGILGTTISTKIVGMNVQYFSLDYTDHLLIRIIFFFVVYLVYSLFNVLYLRKHLGKSSKKVTKKEKVSKKDTKAKKETKAKKSKTTAKAAKKEEVVKVETKSDMVANEDLFANNVDTKNSIIPLAIVGIIAVLTLILAYIPWTTVFEVDWFTKAYEWVINDVKFFNVPIFSYLFGIVQEFGNWDLFGAQVVMLLAMFVLKLCYRVDMNTFIESFAEGFKKVSKLVVILLLAYVVLEFAVMYPVIPTILGSFLGDKINIFTSTFAGILTNLFTVEYQYTVNLVYSNFALLYPNNLGTVSVILQLTYGLVSFFAPSSAMLLLGLSYLNIPYKDWMKYIWKFLLIMLVAIIVVAFIVFM